MTTTAFSVDAARKRFSSLQSGFAFFDAPGGTQVPDEVGEAIADALRTPRPTSARPTRPAAPSRRSSRGAKDDAGRFLGCSPDEVSFGMNMTTLDFALTRTAARDLREGDEILTTQLDHDGGVAPWVEAAADKGMVVRVVAATDELTVDYDDLERQLNERTRVVAFALASNATGSVADAKRICALAREAGALSWIDAVHYAAHEPIDVTELGCDVLLCSPYKFCGPHLGMAYVRRELAESWRPYKARPSDSTPSAGASRRGRSLRAARRLQRDDRLPRLARRIERAARLRARARRALRREPAGERDALRPARDGGPRADVPLQRRGPPRRRRRPHARRARRRHLGGRQLVLRLARRPPARAVAPRRDDPLQHRGEVDRLLAELRSFA